MEEGHCGTAAHGDSEDVVDIDVGMVAEPPILEPAVDLAQQGLRRGNNDETNQDSGPRTASDHRPTWDHR